jgi:hypothetical protein
MSTWFECKARYQKVDQNGKEKTVTEPYLVDAVSFTEAEKRINELLAPYITGEFKITNIKIASFSELIPNEACERWYRCKVTFIGYNEEKGTETKTNTYMLVQANTVKQAFDFIENSMKGTVSDYEIPSIQESPLKDVFPYFEEGEKPQKQESLYDYEKEQIDLREDEEEEN